MPCEKCQGCSLYQEEICNGQPVFLTEKCPIDIRTAALVKRTSLSR